MWKCSWLTLLQLALGDPPWKAIVYQTTNHQNPSCLKGRRWFGSAPSASLRRFHLGGRRHGRYTVLYRDDVPQPPPRAQSARWKQVWLWVHQLVPPSVAIFLRLRLQFLTLVQKSQRFFGHKRALSPQKGLQFILATENRRRRRFFFTIVQEKNVPSAVWLATRTLRQKIAAICIFFAIFGALRSGFGFFSRLILCIWTQPQALNLTSPAV